MAKRAVHQYRPKGEAGAMIYSPQRDLANIYTPMLREVFQGLDAVNWSEDFKELFKQYGVTQDQLEQTVTVFVDAHQLFTRDRSVKSPADAFRKAGVERLNPVIRLALFSRIGEVVMGGFFVAIRDVTMQGQLSPVHADLVDMIAAGRAMAKVLSGHVPAEHTTALDEAEAKVSELQRVLKQAHDIAEAKTQIAYQLSSEISALKRQRDSMIPFLARINGIYKMSFFKRIWYSAGYAIKLIRKTV